MSIGAGDSSFDLAALASLRHQAANAPAGQDKVQLQAAARQFESLFTQMLLKTMRSAGESFRDAGFASQQGDFYQDMFDQQLSLHLSRGRGLGLAEVLIQQLGQGQLAQSEAAAAVAAPPVGSKGAAVAPSVDAGADEHAQRQFVATMWPHAQQVAERLGVDPHAVLAQAVLETGWGRHVPQAGAHSSHNLFGIKAGTSWRGDSTAAATLEYESGVAVERNERFRSYGSVEDSFHDYAGLLGGQRRYAQALDAGQNIAGFAQGLQRAGYATDPQYADKLIALARQLRGMTEQLSPAAAPAPAISGRSAQPLSDDITVLPLKSAAIAPLSTNTLARATETVMTRRPGRESSDG